MRKPVSIYVLEDPSDYRVFYVGKTESKLGARLRCHICDARSGRHSASVEIMDIINRGSRPVIRQIELVPAGGDWIQVEKKWIAYYRAIGVIANKTTGGQGVSGVLRTAEWYEKIVATRTANGKWAEGNKRAAEKNKGRVQTAEERTMRAGLQFDRNHTPETKVKISEAHMGMRHPPDVIKRISDKRRGFKHTEDAKNRITIAAREQAPLRRAEQIARWEDPEYYERVTTSMRNRDAPTQVTKDKLSKTTAAGWEDDGIRRKREDGLRAIMETEEYRAQHRNNMKANWDDPIWRAERLAAQAEGRRKKKLPQP